MNSTLQESLATRESARPILAWATIGVVFLALQIYVYGAWVASPEFAPTDRGTDPVPEYSRIAILVYEIISVVTLPFAIIWFANGIRRTGRIDAVRLLMIGWLSAYWLDPWLSSLRPMFTYNAYATNFGCWCEFIPGWQTPNGSRIAEPLLIDGPSYFTTFAGTALAGLYGMRKAQARWPRISWIGLTVAAFVAIWITMGILDIVATRYLHFDAWPGSFQSASFWGGKFYQFPIYEFVLFPSAFVPCAFLLLHADRDGYTAIERGVKTIATPWLQTTARVLAFIALCNLLNLAYTSAMAVHSLYVDRWPADMPSWLANEQCGPGTNVRCAD